MFSNSRVSTRMGTLLLAAALGLAACNLPLNESPPPAPAAETKFDFDSGCLNEALPTMQKFVEGTASPAAITQVWDCFHDAISLFEKKVRGSGRDVYTAREVAQFFEDFFLKNVHLNDRLLAQVMHFKQIFVGGSNATITKVELQKLREFAIEARDLSLRMNPYMGVFSKSWQFHADRDHQPQLDFFQRANNEAQDVAKILGDRIARSQQDYSIDDFVTLLEELEKLYGDHWDFLDSLRETLPLVKKLKKSLVGGDEGVIRANEWRRFGLLGARGYVQYLRYYYFIQKSSEHPRPDLDLIALSMDDLFSYLGDMVSEKPGGRLTQQELNEILESLRSLFPSLQITPTLVNEGMKIKQVVFGGSRDQFLAEEFAKARTKVTVLKDIVARAEPYWNIYRLKWKPQGLSSQDTLVEFRTAETTLIDVGAQIGKLFEAPYDLADLKTLSAEIVKLLPPANPEDGLDRLVQKSLPLLVAGKRILLNDSNSVIGKSQWSSFLRGGSEVYSRYLWYHYFVEGRDLERGPGLAGLWQMVQQSSQTIENILKTRDSRSISQDEIKRVIDGVVATGSWPDFITSANTKKLLPWMFRKLLVRPSARFEGRAPTGLTTEALAVIRNEMASWVEAQNFFQGVLRDGNAVTSAQLIRAFDAGQLTETKGELRRSIVTPVPASQDSRGRVYLASPARAYTFDALTRLNLARIIDRLVNKAYISDPERLHQRIGFTKDEANQLFKDLREVAVSQEWVDPDNVTFADSRFREANLFVPHADGNDFVSPTEGVDLVLWILSGLELNSQMRDEMFGSCRVSSAPRQNDRRVTLDCYRKIYNRELPGIFTSVPAFARFYDNLDRETADAVMMDLLRGTGWIDDKSGTVRLGDLSLVPHVIQYLETIYLKFDQNRDGILSREEAINAYPVFRETLKSVSPLDSDRILRAGFAFVLVKARIPGAKDMPEFFTRWVGHDGSWPISVNRAQLSKVLGTIVEALATKGPAALPNPEDLRENGRR